jgi:FkbM family methyltransferase
MAVEEISGHSAEMFVPEAIVTAMYRTLLGREPDESGLKTHADFLRGGASLEAFVRTCLTSAEFRSNLGTFLGEYIENSKKLLLLEHSQNGEVDLLVRQMINTAAKHRIAVDVGANGKARSNSYDLLRSCGWKGLLIEANPALIPKLEKEFSGLDIALVHCAVSNSEGKGTLHIGVNDDVSSLTRANTEGWGAMRGEVEVPIRRLGPILEEHKIPTDFDFLSLDIEGEDIPVLNDLIGSTPFRPRWVIIEASWGFTVKTLADAPFSDSVRGLYSIVDQTVSNLILRLH